MRTSSERRRRDRELQRAAANRRVGHDHAYLILFGGQMVVTGVVLLLVCVAVWAWFFVDHARLAGIIGFAGVVILAAYAAWAVRNGTLAGRLTSAARGVTRRGHWHLAGLSGALMVLAAVMIWRQLP
jgi:hypothetical protein